MADWIKIFSFILKKVYVYLWISEKIIHRHLIRKYVTVTTQHTAHNTQHTKIRYYRTGTYVQYDKILGNLHNEQVDDTFDPSSQLPHTYTFIIWLC